jgi:hypothetical protein
MPYLGNQPTASDSLSIFKYVSTASQTTFSGADANGATLSYDVGDGSCQVFLNGVRLDSTTDVTATNGTSVVLAACSAGDIVHIQATKAFIPADVVPKAAGGTFGGAVVAPSLTLSSTPLPVASGGSGAATHAANGVLLGAGTGALTTAAPGASGNVLTSNGTVWASAAAAAGGKIGQILQTQKIDRTSITSTTTNSFAAITGLTQAITPVATSSKVLVTAYVSWNLDSGNGTIHFGIFRDSTQVGMGVDSGGTNRCPSTVSFRGTINGGSSWYTYGMTSQAFQFLDSPSTTSSTTYSIKVSGGATYTSTVIINGTDTTTGNAGSADYQPVASSAIMCMEVLA